MIAEVLALKPRKANLVLHTFSALLDVLVKASTSQPKLVAVDALQTTSENGEL